MTNLPMFEKTDLSILTQSKGIYRELPVYVMEQELFVKVGSGYVRILRNNRTSSSMDWIRFNNGKVPKFSDIGWAKAGGQWKKEPKRTRVR
jgi:hypothetical protein